MLRVDGSSCSLYLQDWSAAVASRTVGGLWWLGSLVVLVAAVELPPC